MVGIAAPINRHLLLLHCIVLTARPVTFQCANNRVAPSLPLTAPPENTHARNEQSLVKKLIPLADRVLVQRAIAATKSVGGIILPESSISKQLEVRRGLSTTHPRRTRQQRLSPSAHNSPNKRSHTPQGTVVAVGPGRVADNGATVPMSVAIGDKVLLPEYG
jgi:chaperonin GroES